MRTLEEQAAARKAEREELYRLDAVLREEARERKAKVVNARELCEYALEVRNRLTLRDYEKEKVSRGT